MKKSFFVIRYRWWIVGLTVAIVLFAALQLFKVNINPDLETYLPDQMESRQNSKLINEIFGNEEPVLIVVESEDVLSRKTLERIEALSAAFEQSGAFTQVLSLFQMQDLSSDDGFMLVNPLVDKLPENAVEVEMIRKKVKDSKFCYGTLISENFHHALIMLSSNKTEPDEALMANVRQILDDNPGDEAVYVTGQPILRSEANNNIARDLMVLLPVGLLLMFVMLWLSFRELKAVLLPFSVVVFSIVISLGMIPLFGWDLSVVGVLIPIMMIAIANNYGVYFIARYQDLNANEPSLSMYRIVQYSVDYLTKPVLFCGLTTVVGVMGLITHFLLPAQQMGVVASIGIAFALLVSLLFIPAVMSMMKKGKPHLGVSNENHGFFARLLNAVSKQVSHAPKLTLSIFTVVFIASTLGLIYFKVAPDSNKILPESHTFNQAIKIVDNEFGGSKMLQLMITADAKDPDFLRFLQTCEAELLKLPQVGTVSSLSSVVEEVSKAMNDKNSAAYGQIPETREGVAQYIELFSMNASPEDLERFVDFDFSRVLLTIQFKASSNADFLQIQDKIQELFAGKSDYQYMTGGYALVENEMSRYVLIGQNYSLAFAFVAIVILLAIIFRSLIAGLIGSIPLAFAVFCTFGMMGWLGIELNIVTALLSSISIGLGVDFTIHVFWRIKWELALGNDYPTSIHHTLTTIGRGISINAFSVMVGFAVLFISAFPLIQTFAFLIIISLFLCLVCALIFIPAFVLLLKPKFLEK